MFVKKKLLRIIEDINIYFSMFYIYVNNVYVNINKLYVNIIIFGMLIN